MWGSDARVVAVLLLLCAAQDPEQVREREEWVKSLFRDRTLDKWNEMVVGSRVKVYWSRENKWYSGTIVKYRREKGKHKSVHAHRVLRAGFSHALRPAESCTTTPTRSGFC